MVANKGRRYEDSCCSEGLMSIVHLSILAGGRRARVHIDGAAHCCYIWRCMCSYYSQARKPHHSTCSS